MLLSTVIFFSLILGLSFGKFFETEAQDFTVTSYFLDHSVDWFYVTYPKSIQYTFPMKISRDFGGPLRTEPFVTDLMVADPLHACDPLKNTNAKNTVIISQRGGGCSFLEKTLNIQNSGARVALIYNNEEVDQWIYMGEDGTDRVDQITISPYFIYYTDGAELVKTIGTDRVPVVIPMNYTASEVKSPPWRQWHDEFTLN